jgi:hypothetical protein
MKMKWLGIGAYGLVCLTAIVLGIAVGLVVSLLSANWLFVQLVL